MLEFAKSFIASNAVISGIQKIVFPQLLKKKKFWFLLSSLVNEPRRSVAA